MPWCCGSYSDWALQAIGWDSFVFEHHYCSCCVGTKHPFLRVLSVAERLTQRELSEWPQSNRMELWGCCGMCCKEPLTWFRGVTAPFLLSHQPLILYIAQVLLQTICFTVDSALPAVFESKEQVALSPYKKSFLPLNAPVRSLTNISSKKCAGRPCSYVAYVCLSVSLICCLCTHSSRNAAAIYEEIMNWKRKNI